jgi:hypothetical protein
VEKLTSAFRDQLRLGCAVASIERTPRGVVVNDSHGSSDTYDHVVIASHSDQALAMLSDADDRERAVLGAIGYAPNTVYLHRDVRLMPKRRRAWASSFEPDPALTFGKYIQPKRIATRLMPRPRFILATSCMRVSSRSGIASAIA